VRALQSETTFAHWMSASAHSADAFAQPLPDVTSAWPQEVGPSEDACRVNDNPE
jgi:hypothetical protein